MSVVSISKLLKYWIGLSMSNSLTSPRRPLLSGLRKRRYELCLRRGYSATLDLVFAVDALLEDVVLARLGFLHFGQDQADELGLVRVGHQWQSLERRESVVGPPAQLEDLLHLGAVLRWVVSLVLRGLSERRPGGRGPPEVDCRAVRVAPHALFFCARERQVVLADHPLDLRDRVEVAV